MSIFPYNLAVVGNGPIELGKGLGKDIDAYDHIIRFNDYVIRPEYEDDYGDRVTDWATSFCTGIKHRKEPYNNVYVPFPLMDKRCPALYQIDKRLHATYKQYVHFIPYEYYADLIKLMRELHPTYRKDRPSTGISLLYWIYRDRGYLNAEDVFGFNFFDKTVGHHYFNNKTIQCVHDEKTEKKIFAHITQEKD